MLCAATRKQVKVIRRNECDDGRSLSVLVDRDLELFKAGATGELTVGMPYEISRLPKGILQPFLRVPTHPR